MTLDTDAPGTPGRVVRSGCRWRQFAVTIVSGLLVACGGSAPGGGEGEPPVVAALSSDTLTAGARLTLTGRGFGSSVSAVAVQIGGRAATVLQAAGTSVLLEVPAVCQPLGAVDVQLSVAGVAAPVVRAVFRPGPAAALPVGEVQLLPTGCVQLAANTAGDEYLVGVLNANESPAGLVDVQLVGRGPDAVVLGAAGARAAAPSPVRTDESVIGAATPARSLTTAEARRRQRLEQHAEAEAALRHADAVLPRPLAPERPVGGVRVNLGPATAVGDTVTLRYAFGGCTPTATIRAVVRQRGTRSLWLEDLANPSGGFEPADYAQLAAAFDARIFAIDSATWGAPTDQDGNGRIAIVVSREVNRQGGALGFVTQADLLPSTGPGACPRSNGGEYYYARAPDPTGAIAGQPYSRADALRDAPLLLAHEVVHIIQFGRRLAAGQPALEFWESEGQATLAEQLNGFAADGIGPEANAGLGVAFSAFDPARVGWHADTFIDLAQFQGLGCQLRASDGSCAAPVRVPGAPAACSPLATSTFAGYPDMGAPCTGRRAAYGVPALLIRYAAERYGPGRQGSSSALLAALVSSGQVGLANLSGRAGLPAEQLLAEFYAALYADDRYPGGPPTALGFRAWNLRDIYEGSVVGAGGVVRALPAEARLAPTLRGGVAFADRLTVRGGSAALTLLRGPAPPVAVGLEPVSPGSAVPAGARLFVVRLR